LFEPATIERMAAHFQTLLQGVVANPDTPIADLPLLTARERRQLLVEWNETPRPLPATPLVHELFAEHAIQHPNAPALLFEDQRLTFDQINSRANQLARCLLGCGLKPEARVGVMLPRSPDTLVALLAIFKAGGCYLPLDPEYPAERRAFMLEDAGASVVITEEFMRVQLSEQSRENLQIEVRPEQLAYIIYTSGSTGRPKGVAVEHRQLLHTLQAAQEVLRLTEADCLPSIASFSFDISLLELLLAPLAGGRCLLVSTHGALEATVTARVLQEATVLHAVPGLMRRFVSVTNGEQYPQLRLLLVGGEAVAPELVAEMQAVWANADVRVLYGPTEATIICASYEVSKTINHQMIGRPLPNTVLRILNGNGKSVPIGVDGEIYIGGAGVARGYWQSPELTAEKFVSAEDGTRIYRTGDRGRYLSDGNIEFTGRMDEQVKVRGFRIELGEIESVLTEHESVREAVVVALDDKGGEKRLVAYVVTDAARNVSDLRSHLKERLPDYMIPSAFVYLDALPLTSHGKIDRRALPAPDAERPALAEAFIAPRTPAEKSLASIWTKLLGINRVGINDSYFELGGDSLLATQLASQVRNLFEVELPLVKLFRHPTLAEMATSIEEAIIEQMEEISDDEAEQLLLPQKSTK
jgi:amino acid adenylation domain-containing protein